jgi:hypothetical protein
MLEGVFRQTINLALRGRGSQEPLPREHPYRKKLRDLGYAGPEPRTVAEAEGWLWQQEFSAEPPTTQQRRLIELICLYGGDCLDDKTQALTSRWEAGCWIKAHIHLAGDWPYFDG